MRNREEFDYIVVGSGSAGAVIAWPTFGQCRKRVLLIEQGSPNTGWTVRMPGATRQNFRPRARYMRWYQTEPQEHLNRRVIDHPRGIGLGGSSLVNGMVFLRGSPSDYDRWAADGLPGWSYANLLPYFKRMESRAEGRDSYRGDSGPVGVRRKSDLDLLSQAFLDAGRQAGYSYTEDVNGYRQEGFCLFDMNVDHGFRASAAYAYLERRGPKPNLDVRTGAAVRRVLIDGPRATGVELLHNGQITTVRAGREIIISAGAIGSPQLLLLSGIGPADELKKLGITPVHDLPGVGRNLHDHMELDLQWECTKPISFNRYLKLHNKLRIGFEWFAFKSGFGSTNQCHVGAFVRSQPEVLHPNIQFHFIPAAFNGWIARSDLYGFRVLSRPYAADEPRAPHIAFRQSTRFTDTRPKLLVD